MLIAGRRQPMTLNLLLLQEPRANEKQGWVVATPDSTLLPTPRNSFRVWWAGPDSRLVVFASLVTMLLGIFVTVLALARILK